MGCVRDNRVYQEYSGNREYRFEVYLNPGFYEVWVQQKFTDEYMGSDWFAYYDVPDYMHRTDTLARAIEIGRECIYR